MQRVIPTIHFPFAYSLSLKCQAVHSHAFHTKIFIVALLEE